MKAKKTLFGFAALFLAAVFSLTSLACKNEEEDDSGIDSALVAKWYSSQTDANAQGTAMYEFKSDGKLFSMGNELTSYTCSTSDGKITFNNSTSSHLNGDCDYTISGNKLTIANGTRSQINNGDYYKKQ